VEARRKFDAEFKEGAVRIVRETGKPIARVVSQDPPCVGVYLRRDEATQPRRFDGVISAVGAQRAPPADRGAFSEGAPQFRPR
jgi:hypothetical protein